MNNMTSHRYPLLLLVAIISIVSATAGRNAFAETCPTGTVDITAATRQAATDAGIPTSAQCWNPTDANVGQAAGEAKAFLMQHATKDANIACLNADFAQKLVKFMQAVPGGVPVITSGYRGQADQEKAKASGASQVGWCQGYHNYGMAADFNSTDKTRLLWMRINAPLYGLTKISTMSVSTGCSMVPGSTFCDPAHIQINASLPPINQCGICSSTGGTGTLPSQPNPYSPNDDYQTPTRLPQSSFPGAPVPTTAPATTPAASVPATTAPAPVISSATSSGICSPAFSCSNNVMYYQTTSCTTQVYQTCSSGCNGNSCAVISPTAGTSTLSTTNSSTQASSTSDLLNALSNPVSLSATTIGKAVPIAVTLNGNTSDVAGLNGNTTSSIVNPGTISSIQPITSQQTFTSGDLSNTGASSYNTQSSSTFKILIDLKAALVWAINFLKSL
jgi:hypothetical protein